MFAGVRTPGLPSGAGARTGLKSRAQHSGSAVITRTPDTPLSLLSVLHCHQLQCSDLLYRSVTRDGGSLVFEKYSQQSPNVKWGLRGLSCSREMECICCVL